jgi:hypothetical protein
VAALVALFVAAGFLTWFFIYRVRNRATRSFPDLWWGAAHHIVFVAVALLTVLVAFLPRDIFGPPGTIDKHSGLVISGAIVTFLLAPLTITVGAMVTFVRNAWARRSVLVIVWLLTLGLLVLHFEAWAR